MEEFYGAWHNRQAECKQAGLSRKTVLKVQECINQAYVDEAKKAGHEANPLLATADTRAALEFSKGKIDKDEYEAKIKENEAIVRTYEAQAQAQQRANMAAAFQGGMNSASQGYFAAARSYQPPAYTPPIYTPKINCFTNGPYTTCH